MRDNYVLAKDLAPEVQVQFEKEAALGAMRELDLETAEQMLGPLSVASLGALAKKDGSYRVIHDATHGLAVNSKIRVLDQIRSPTATDVRRAIQGLPGAFFALTGDLARAHRLVKIDQQVETPFEKRIVTLIYKRKFSKVPFEKADALLRKSFS